MLQRGRTACNQRHKSPRLTAVLGEEGAAMAPPGRIEGSPEKKRGRSGHERPKSREETPKEGYDKRAGLAMSHRKSYWCAAAISNAFFAELPFQKQGLMQLGFPP